MKTTSNKDMLNAIRNQASEEYKERIPAVVNDEDIMLVASKLNEYQTIKNEFFNTLTNKIVRTDFFSKVYSNPLKMLKKGMLPYGNTIEQLFVQHANAKGFYKDKAFDPAGSFLTSGDGAGQVKQEDGVQELVGQKASTIKNLYISRNYAHLFDVSISDAQLKQAFLNPNGLSEMVNQLVGSLTSGAELKEYKDIITLLKASAMAAKPKTDTKGAIDAADPADYGDSQPADTYIQASKGIAKTMAIKEVSLVGGGAGSTEAHALAIAIKGMAQRLKFMSNEYNMAGVQTFSRPEDLVFLTTPEKLAELEVDVLAMAFNVSKAEVGTRIIVVDSLPKKIAKGFSANGTSAPVSVEQRECLGILMDKDFIQCIDTVNETRQFENGRTLHTNVFLHRQGIMANCYFANCVAFVKA